MNPIHHALTDWLIKGRQQPDSHRQLLIISGTVLFCKETVAHILSTFPTSSPCILGQSPLALQNAIAMNAYRQLLGSECELAIVDAFDTLRPNAILAVAGTLTQGGMMVLCCPDCTEWPAYPEINTGHYLSYNEKLTHSALRAALIRQFYADKTVAILREGHEPKLPLRLTAKNAAATQFSPFKSAQQRHIFLQLLDKLPIASAMITADRGRGKSTLLGMVSGQRLLQEATSIVLTSRYPDAVQQVFKGLLLTCANAKQVDRHTVSYKGLTCKWLPLDHPLLNDTQDAILIIDEAASIPIPQLTALCQSSQHVLISTTIRGYEGSGRGFVTRFLPWLKQHRPDIAHYNLTTPIRWFKDDPVEQFWYSAFCLTPSSPALQNDKQFHHETMAPTIISLAKDDYSGRINRQLLPLLMQAHYQTTADELVRLYDGPNNHTLLACINSTVVGVVNYQQEGSRLLNDVASDIACGKRRVNGHLSAQGLGLLLASTDITTATYWRINRIAIVPAHRRKGIATKLIKELTRQAQLSGIDGLTTSFGATSNLVNFWQHNGFSPAKPGLKMDAASGEYSLLMYKTVSERLVTFESLIAQRFAQELALHPAPTRFGRFNPPVSHCDKALYACSMKILQQVIDGTRSIQHGRGTIAWLMQNQTRTQAASANISVIRDFIENINDLSSFIHQYKLTGKRDAESLVAKQLQELLLHNSDKSY